MQGQADSTLLCWYIILYSHNKFPFCGVKLFLCVVCFKLSYVQWIVKYSCSSCGVGLCIAQKDLHKVVVTYVFLVCVQFGLYYAIPGLQ